MPRVVPSQVVQFIDQVFPWAGTQVAGGVQNLTRQRANQLAGLLELVEKIPDELLTMNGVEYGSFVCSVAAIRERLKLWLAQQAVENELVFLEGFPQFSPVRLIRDAISGCSDDSPAAPTSDLNFITHADFRESLRKDIGAINRALSNGEWKAATVLAGSTIEALLLWDLQNRRQATFPAAVTALVANHTFQQQPDPNPEDRSWSLYHYIEVERHLGIIAAETATEARLAKNFRDLIHPGRAQRLGQNYDRGTALSSVAALEHVVRDLT